jgi:hypothetical protein
MLKRFLMIMIIAITASVSMPTQVEAAPPGQPADWQRFYHYPYVYYPHSFQQQQPNDSMYYKYGPAMRIPVYNKAWYNFYPTEKPYHSGHHFLLDVF